MLFASCFALFETIDHLLNPLWYRNIARTEVPEYRTRFNADEYDEKRYPNLSVGADAELRGLHSPVHHSREEHDEEVE
jgi:hypothetical protein